MVESVDRLFLKIRAIPFFLRMTLFTRIMLAAGFIPTGMVKVLGRRFTTMPVDTTVGSFFEAMYQTGMYWQFLGASQVLAGILLLIPRFAHIGALMFIPIMLNIFIITVSLGFKGTPIVTGMMLLAVIYLFSYDYHRFRSIFTTRDWAPNQVLPDLKLDWMERIGFWTVSMSLLAVFGATRSFVSSSMVQSFILLGFGAGLFTFARFLVVGRRMTS